MPHDFYVSIFGGQDHALSVTLVPRFTTSAPLMAGVRIIMKYIWILLLILSSGVSEASEKPYGVWKYSGTLVFVEILETGNTFQCRINKDGSAITASGKYDGKTTITWEPVKVVDENGNPIEMNFSWEQDDVIVGESTISLSGPYGIFSYLKTNKELPSLCR